MNLGFWTDLADGAVSIPVGVGVPLVLALVGERRAAASWALAVGGTWAVILVLKLAGYALAALDPGSLLGAIHLVTPSGHVASATVIYAGLVGLLLRRTPMVLARTAAAAFVIAGTAGTVLVLSHMHSVAEVMVGGLVGLVGAVALAAMAGPPLARWLPLPILALIGLVVIARHGMHLTWEHTIAAVAEQAVAGWRTRA